MPVVTGPDGRRLRFPDGTDPAMVMQVLQQQYPDADWGGASKPAAPKTITPKAPGDAELARQAYDDSSFGQRALISAGAEFKALGRGIGQIFTPNDSAAHKAITASANADRPFADAPHGGANLVGRALPYLATIPLGGPEAAVAGRLPAGASALARLAAKALPAAAEGAAYGAAREVRDGESRGQNAAVGAGAGLAGRGALGGLRVGANTTSALFAPLFQRGQERIAANAIRRAALDPASLLRSSESGVPGVQRSLAEVSLDPGVAQLQRQFPVEMADQYSGNNTARVAAIRGAFHGADDAAVGRIEAARDEEATRVLAGLKGVVNEPAPHNPFGSVGGQPPPAPQAISLQPVAGLIRNLVGQQEGRPAVQSALQYVHSLLAKPIRNADEAYNIRKTIGDLMDGRIGGDQASSKTARRELLQVRDALDEQMAAAFPEWGQYLGRYRAASTMADQARVGKELLDRAGQVADATTGERSLTPAVLGRAANDADALVRSATGFNKSVAAKTLTADQLKLLSALGDDAASMNVVNNLGRMVGSNTAQNFATQNLLSNALGNGRLAEMVTGLQPVQRLTTPLEKYFYGSFGAPEAIKRSMTVLLKNPAKARAALARLSAPKGKLAMLADRTSAKLPQGGAAAYDTQPLELSIVGGQAVPAAALDAQLRAAGY